MNLINQVLVELIRPFEQNQIDDTKHACLISTPETPLLGPAQAAEQNPDKIAVISHQPLYQQK